MKMLSICAYRKICNNLPTDIIQRDNSPLQISIRMAHGVQEILRNNDPPEHTLIISYAVILEFDLRRDQ